MNQTPEDIDTLITATYDQLIAAQATKTALLTLLSNAGSATAFSTTDDVVTMSRAGLDGSESYTRTSLLARLEALTTQEKLLTETYASQLALKNKMFPTVHVEDYYRRYY